MAPIHKFSDRVKVVITGFEPFGKHVTNPSWQAVRVLNNLTLDLPSPSPKAGAAHHKATKVDIVCQELPVEYRKVPDLVPELHVTHSKPAVTLDANQDAQKEYLKTYYIHVGVGHDGHTAIETQAHRTGYGHPDNASWFPESKEEAPVKKEAWAADPDVLTTTVDTLALAEYLKTEKGWICQQSMDAGHYLCEYTFYLSMAERHRRILSGQESEHDRACLFVHVPSVGNPYTLEELQRFVQDMVVAVASQY
ncbi:pyroglutamyl-peptidase [Entomortierella parvispora]|uniref:Pyroglutamyl-peptidase n=1 Tax=Entomortierella parvispora TaxID=205924 RepID=A0A9P3H2R5_9FUNG|nr:pyroglutamyl-peptidase [Entomortierella parvispora]